MRDETEGKLALNENAYYEKLAHLLSQDLDFHDQISRYASHNFHSFPAKFPPQLPRKFITELTDPGDIILDPMVGSGTTIVEAFLSGRQGVGFDIDPLALLISKVKVNPLDINQIIEIGANIIKRSNLNIEKSRDELKSLLAKKWDSKTKEFIDYWFMPETQIELMAIRKEIEGINDQAIRAFFDLAFSSTIITKSGGVSLALDLAHTRPHRAKVIITKAGNIQLEKGLIEDAKRTKILTKNLRPAIGEFEKRFKQNLKGLIKSDSKEAEWFISYGDAKNLPLINNFVDLIVTSPPYASNAIDYIRAHKFSLVWMDYSIESLGQKRKDYIGSEKTNEEDLERLPNNTAELVNNITKLDPKKGLILHRYYSEMSKALSEMFRVLKPNKSAIVVVGSSILRGIDTETQNCLVEIGREIGFEVPKIGVRNLDRNRRMLPAGSELNLGSQIQQRMHKEYVIGFYKPDI
jgi:DNA modification methylase